MENFLISLLLMYITHFTQKYILTAFNIHPIWGDLSFKLPRTLLSKLYVGRDPPIVQLHGIDSFVTSELEVRV